EDPSRTDRLEVRSGAKRVSDERRGGREVIEEADLIDRLCAAPRNAVAAIDDSGQALVYAEPLAAARALLEAIGHERKLILLEGGSTISWLIAYVAALLGRHPLLIAPAGGVVAMAQLEAAFAPALRLVAAHGYQPEETGVAGDAPLHPDLAVLLSTSG